GGRLERDHAGVVDQDVDPAAERLCGAGGEVGGGSAVVEVGGQKCRRPTGGTDGVDNGPAAVLVPAADGHGGASRGQAQRGGSADAAGGPGDQCGPAGEVRHGYPSLGSGFGRRRPIRRPEVSLSPSTETGGLVFPAI